jgi:hypothetical protein
MMRCTLRSLILVVALLVAATLVAAPQPVASASPAAVTTASSTQRHFGAGAYTAVRDAVAAASRSCSVSNDALTAMVLAPVFGESSAATTPETAPAPMTLSRFDEWSGVKATDTNKNANYGLYAFQNPSTTYKRAFWNPGIGIWQFDSAGLGAPLTTVEAMDVGVVAGAVAGEVSGRYCAATGTDAQRRDAAWAAWSACDLVVNGVKACEGFFQEMMGTTPPFQNLVLVDGISALGGVKARTCSLDGVSGTLPCWYVEPSVGVIEGATAWATWTPLDGGSPTATPTPLSAPFYVVDRGTTEERHWLRADTGYDIDIRASRTIGKNARPRSNQAGSGLTWTGSSTLCDVTTGRGLCGPVPPAGVSSKAFTINGTYQPIHLDANGDGRGDIIWYTPDSSTDPIWIGTGPGTFASYSTQVTKSYETSVLDADGDGDDDLLWYEKSTGTTYLWRYAGNGTFSSQLVGNQVPNRQALPLQIDADAPKEIFWYGPGSIPDTVWSWDGTKYVSSARTVSGSTYQPFVGDFDGNDRDDIVWYAPGTAADWIWFHGVTGNMTAKSITINSTFITGVGRLDGDMRDDIFWYGSGSAPDSVWFGGSGGVFAVQGFSVNKPYQPSIADVLGTTRDQVIWYAPGPASDAMWQWTDDRVMSSQELVLPKTQQPIVGLFSVGATDGILWYGVGTLSDVLWYR